LTGRRILVVAEMQGRDLLRRKLALVLLTVLPVGFYVADRSTSQGIVTGATAMGWGIAIAALFAMLGSRRIDPRLTLSGFRPHELLLGRLLLLDGIAAVLVTAFSILLALGSHPERIALLVVGVVLIAWVAVPLGLAIGALLPRELEGTLAIVGVVGIELTLKKDSLAAQFLPLDGGGRVLLAAEGWSEPLAWATIHDVAYGAALLALAAGLWARRVRVRRRGPAPDSGAARAVAVELRG